MLLKLWGAEKVVENWYQLFPDADIFTLIYNEKKVSKIFPKHKIHSQVFQATTQKIYNITKKQRLCLPFMSTSIESFDLSNYDVVLVSSSWFAHGVITKPETKTIVYYHAPARYMWDWTNEYKKDIGANSWIKWYILNSLFLKLRQWDYIASKRHDITLANSKTTQSRLQKYFRLESKVLYPPIETKRFAKKIQTHITPPFTSYYIILSALTEFKKIDIAITAFQNIADTNLVIIGSWEHGEILKKQSGQSKNISFVWAQFWDDLVSYVQQSSGLIFPWEEDFGIVPIEMMAAGKPVFALAKGWLTETVLPWVTWDFFFHSDGSDFEEQFTYFHTKNIKWEYSEDNCKKKAAIYDKELFEKRIQELVDTPKIQ